MVDSSVLALVIVGIIGYCIINKDKNAKMLTWADVGKLLLVFAIIEGLMYLVAPLPMRLVCSKPARTLEGMFFGGDHTWHDGGIHNIGAYNQHADQLQVLTGGGGDIRAGSVLDSVV